VSPSSVRKNSFSGRGICWAGVRTRLQKSKNILFGSSGCGRCVNTQTNSEWMLKVAFGNTV
jgi:hypothetical protein